MRAFRPSRCSPFETELEEGDFEDRLREEKVEVYRWRAKAGLPLFDEREPMVEAREQQK
ncbi:MAG TPA: hypothetical protein VMZ50_05195 [Phycisphaerae bacterium]|nr:hypothetical protein [Phycisphaerae bacterium]